MREDYFKWICDLVSVRFRNGGASYKKLLRYLFDVEFVAMIGRDENRAVDGKDLKYRYAYDKGLTYETVDQYIYDERCSMLEMLVALANRIEEQIMCDPDIGNRTGKWFWDMVENIGLADMTDSKFDMQNVSMIIYRFIHREYEPNGRGGVVCIPGCEHDLREVEIWCQVMWYLTKYY